jgi:hypothetical protein
MAFSFIANAFNTSAGAGATLDCLSPIDVLAGDSLIIVGAWEGGSASSLVYSDDDGSTNVATLLAEYTSGSNYIRIGYVLSATASTGSIMRMAMTSGPTYRSITVWQFRPDGGETVTLDAGPSPAGATSTSIQSGNINITGTDVAVVSATKLYAAATLSDHQINDTAADGTINNGSYFRGWHKLLSGAASGVHGQATASPSIAWACDIIALKSGTGDSVKPVLYTRAID